MEGEMGRWTGGWEMWVTKQENTEDTYVAMVQQLALTGQDEADIYYATLRT